MPGATACWSWPPPAPRATSTTCRRCASVRAHSRRSRRWTGISTRSRPIRTRRSCAPWWRRASAWNACRWASCGMCSRPCPGWIRPGSSSPPVSPRCTNTSRPSRWAPTSPWTTWRRCGAGRRCSADARSGCGSTWAMAPATTRRSPPAARIPSSACRCSASTSSSMPPARWAWWSPACIRTWAAAWTTPATGGRCATRWPDSPAASAPCPAWTSAAACPFPTASRTNPSTCRPGRPAWTRCARCIRRSSW